MRTIVHISDLHFGKIDYSIITPMAQYVADLKPDLIAVSGDLTQRARREEFVEAKKFLDELPFEKIIVPGNHDVPLHNIFSRFLYSLVRYRRYITPNLQPFFLDDEIAVMGLNTARSFTIKDGRINLRQIAQIRENFAHLAPEIIKIIVTHHPLDLPTHFDTSGLVGRAQLAMATIAESRVDLLLGGHTHIAHTGNTAARYEISGYSGIVVQAGTATSTRGRGEPNSLNLIQINYPEIVVERFNWQSDTKKFASFSRERFTKTAGHWSSL